MTGLIKVGAVGQVVKHIVKGGQKFMHRDGLHNVEKGCVQNINNIKKRRRHVRTIDNFEEIEATIDSGAACCVFPPDLCSVVPIRQCAESRRGLVFPAACGQNMKASETAAHHSDVSNGRNEGSSSTTSESADSSSDGSTSSGAHTVQSLVGGRRSRTRAQC